MNNKLHKHSLIGTISIGLVIRVGIAHTYKKEYGWSDYSESNYILEKISKKEIIGRSEQYNHELITICHKDLDSGRFELHIN